MKLSSNTIKVLGVLLIMHFFGGCKKFLEVNPPKSKTPSESVFSNDVTATAAVTGIYVDLMDLNSFASGSSSSVTALAGLSADELDNFLRDNPDVVQFTDNQLVANNPTVLTLWTSLYKTIYEANSVLKGLRASDAISVPVKQRLEGEALFSRAFANFYLTNLFGPVPLILTTDYDQNSNIGRTSVESMYQQIIDDLLAAKAKLPENYSDREDDFVTMSRARPNKYAASAFLARVYLFMENWQLAEMESTEILNNLNLYDLVGINDVFLKNSKEAIWQIRPRTNNSNGCTNEAFFFTYFDPSYFVLRNDFVNAFDSQDARLANWIRLSPSSMGDKFVPFKYKQPDAGSTLTEYSMVFRVAEQYLIRAEARAHLNNLDGAIEDIDRIRTRAVVPLIADTDPTIDQEHLLIAIDSERKFELFTEWGHRWFDLIRTQKASDVLSPIKPQWSTDDQLYPIPQSELNKNPGLKDQNSGY